MKEIKAYIRPLVTNRIVKDLEGAGAKDMTLIRVDAIKPLPYQDREEEAAFAKCLTRCSEVAKLELVCRDDEAQRFVEIIRAGAHTGKKGDGRIFVSSVDEAVNVRTGVTGEAAL